jgi:hypothetical protein
VSEREAFGLVDLFGGLDRQYVKHRWVGDDPHCIVCGITMTDWEFAIENARMVDWDCEAIQNRERNADEQL